LSVFADLFGFVCCVVDGGGRGAEGLAFDLVVEVGPAFVGRDQVAVPPVGGCPVKDVAELDVLRVVRTLEEVQNPHLRAHNRKSPNYSIGAHGLMTGLRPSHRPIISVQKYTKKIKKEAG